MLPINLSLYELVAVQRLKAMKYGRKNFHNWINCGECDGCRHADCKTCINCLDKPRFGGEGIRKQRCIAKRCHNRIRICSDIAFSSLTGGINPNDTPIVSSRHGMTFLEVNDQPNMNIAYH